MPKFNSDEFPELQSGTRVDEIQGNSAEKRAKDLKFEKANSKQTFVSVRASKRARRIPKVFTPPKSGSSCYCLCQREDTGWYLICSFQIAGCLTYYHPQCVGLGQLKSQDDGVCYSNCEDRKSYMCPLCETRNLNFDEQENTVTSLPCRENLPKPQKNERSCMNEWKTYLSSDNSCEIPEENLSHVTGKTRLNEWDNAAVNLLPNSIDANPTQIDHNKNGSRNTLQHLSDCQPDL